MNAIRSSGTMQLASKYGPIRATYTPTVSPQYTFLNQKHRGADHPVTIMADSIDAAITELEDLIAHNDVYRFRS